MELKSIDRKGNDLQYNRGAPTFFHQMVSLDTRKEFVREIIGSITESEITELVVDDFIKKANNAIKPKATKEKEKTGGARVSPEEL